MTDGQEVKDGGEPRQRRERFMAAMVEASAGCGGRPIALLTAAPQAVRSNDVHHRYRADSDLIYLTGFTEPECALLLAPGRPQPVTLFVRPRDPEREVWDGWRAGPEGARERFGADASYPIGELWSRLEEAVKDAGTVFYGLGKDARADARLGELLAKLRWESRLGSGCPSAVIDPMPILHEMRLEKSAAELGTMERAGEIAVAAHRAAMRGTRPGIWEYEIEALVEAEFRRAGASGPSYPSIVAAGVNATVLHYIENQSRAAAGDLLLLDAGCEVEGYASDVTRTFPVSGRFSAPQRALYEVVLAAQQAALEHVRPGETIFSVHRAALGVLTAGLIDLGLLPRPAGGVEEAVESEAYKPYYMHRTSHWLGLDVHDVGAYKHGDVWRPLEPGMVLTVEPGLYISATAEQAPAEFRGIGIRIEDDVVVTDDGHRVLTAGVPTAVAEIEALIGTA